MGKATKMSPLVALTIILVAVSAAPSQTNKQASKNSVSQPQDAEEGSSQQQQHNRQKRAIPLIPFLIYAKSSGGNNGDLSDAPPKVAQMLQMSTADRINQIATHASMSGPLATLGTMFLIISAGMAMNYQSAVNGRRGRGLLVNRRSGGEVDRVENYGYLSNLIDSLGSQW